MEESRYKPLKILGKGAFGEVYKVADTTKCPTYALKVFTDDRGKRDFDREVQAFLLLSAKPHCNEFILCIQDYGKTAEGSYFILTELMNGDLVDFTSKSRGKYRITNPIAILLFMLQCLLSLKGIAEAGAAHSDIKPANILYKVSDNIKISGTIFNDPSIIRQFVRFKIGDLGLVCTDPRLKEQSIRLKDLRTCSPGGSTLYMAPDFYRALEQKLNISDIQFFQANDIWGMGQVFLAMLFGSRGILDPTKITSQTDIRLRTYTSGVPEYQSFDNSINEILTNMLVFDYRNRKTATELADAIDKFLGTKLGVY